MLRSWLAACCAPAPANLVDTLSAHVFDPADAQRWALGDTHELRWYRGILRVTARAQSPTRRRLAQAASTLEEPPASQAVAWRVSRAGSKKLPGWGGRLVLRRAGPGHFGALLTLPMTLQLRARSGDDRFQLTAKGKARPLKKQFQARAVPAWDRQGPVVTDHQGRLLWVAGLGWDARVGHVAGGWTLEWLSDPSV